MLLSYTHGYLFIANQKVASESLHLAAGDDAELAFTQINRDKHITFDPLKEMLGGAGLDLEYSDLLVFSIVREPADWYVSWFNSRARAPLANPAHKRHRVYTGATDFDTFLKLAAEDPPHPMTKIKKQKPFFKSADGPQIQAIPFPLLSELFPRLVGGAASLSSFRLGETRYHKNKSTIRRLSASDLTPEQRRFINEELFPRDWELFQQALHDADGLKPAQPQPERARHLRQQLEERADLAELAFETAYSIAQTRLYRGDDTEAVRRDLMRYKTVDVETVIAEVSKRVARFKREKDLS